MTLADKSSSLARKIKELRELEKLATPGPRSFIENSETIVSNQSHPIAKLSDKFHRQCYHGTGFDGPYIVAATNMLPKLLDALEIMDSGLNQWKESYENGRSPCDKGGNPATKIQAKVDELFSKP